jgi:hypothetical protein
MITYNVYKERDRKWPKRGYLVLYVCCVNTVFENYLGNEHCSITFVFTDNICFICVCREARECAEERRDFINVNRGVRGRQRTFDVMVNCVN